MLKSLEHSLRRHRLVRPGERVGVAVSGGADSVALLRAFAELAPSLGVVLFVLHFNHQLRGLDSQADADFVAALAAQLSLEAAIESADVAWLAAQWHLSLEAAGRRARYEFFQRAATDHRLDCVATAHTRDDQAETVLLRLLRGTGTSGLAGIHRTCDLSALCGSDHPRVSDRSSAPSCVPASVSDRPSAPGCLPSPRLIRPLLSTSRQQVEQYLVTLEQPFRQDASNLSPRFLRNRVRAQLLPAIEHDFNPQLRQALCETAEIAAAENAFLEDLVSAILRPPAAPAPVISENAAAAPAVDLGSEIGIELPLFQSQPVALQRRILRRFCRPHGLALDFAQLENLREFALAAHAGSLQLPRGFAAAIVRPNLRPPHLRLLAPKSI
jgi:tRNA(Ile)-lysidine synthase